jgi:acetylserotonin N-methyltransferase
MPTDITRPDPTVVLDLIEAFRRSKTMFAAVALGVFDALAGGPKQLEELATELKTSRDGLERLLDSCVCLQLLRKGAGGYENTPAAATYLCKSSPDRLTGYLNYSNEVSWKLWAHLEDAVREGGHRWKQVYGWDGPIFSHFFRDETAKREFLMGMNGLGLLSSPQVASAFDLSRFKRFVDLGGATGHLAVAACGRWPNLRAVVFDLPEVVMLAREMIGGSKVADRIEIVAGDFFADPLPEGDLFALGRIIHDWNEEKILKLLGRIRDRLSANGALLVAEKLLDDDKAGPRLGQMQNLNMLTCTEGKERTLGEYEVLLKRAGFTDVRGCRTPAPLDAVMAVKAV